MGLFGDVVGFVGGAVDAVGGAIGAPSIMDAIGPSLP